MKLKSFITLFALLFGGATAVSATDLMSQNFDSGFTAGVLRGTAKFAGGDYFVQDDSGSMEIVSDAKSAPNALRIGRKGVVGFTTFRANKAAAYGNDFKVSFDVKVPAGNNATVFIGGRGQAPMGAVNLSGNGKVRGYNIKSVWTDSGLPKIPADQWVNVVVNFNGANKSYDVSVTYPDGTVKTSGRDFPFLKKANVSEVRFLNSLPKGSSYIIDNVVLTNLGKGDAGGIKNGVVLEQNFDEDFKSGALADGGSFSGGKWLLDADPENYFIVTEPANSKPHALKIMRDGRNGFFALRPRVRIPANRDYTIEMSVYCPTAAGTVLHMANNIGYVGGILLQGENPVRGYNVAMSWEKCGDDMPVLPANTWVKVKIDVNCNQAYYTVSISLPDGKTYNGTTQHPFLNKGSVEELRFVNILPQKSFAFIDDVKMYYSDAISTAGRENYSAAATSTNADFESMLKGKGSWKVDGNTVEMEISPPVKINALLFSGKKLPGKVTVKALNAGGHWMTVGNDMVIPADGFLEFAELNQILKLTLQFKDFAGSALTALGVFSPVLPPQGELDRQWSKKLDAEYDLPVYDRQYDGCNVANLTFVNHTQAPLKIKVVMHERLKNKPFRTFKHVIPVGTSNYEISLDTVPNGEYLTTIFDDSSASSGKIVRLLRHCTSPETTAVPLKEMTGEKIYFPDDFFLADCQNIRFSTGVAKSHLVKQGTTDNDSWIVYGNNMGIDSDGNLVINFRTMNRLWQTASVKRYHAVGSFDDLDNWQINDEYVSVSNPNNPLTGDIPPAAKPDWNRKKGPDGKINYRFYDPAKDGPIQLNQLRCEFISPAAAGTLGYTDYNWGVMRPSAAHVWTVWYKAPGEALIVGKNSLISGFPAPGNVEPPNSGSDLGFGQWLSDDGKTLYFGFGRHLVRYLPYRAEYDNMPDRARIVGIWRTTDGIHWEQGFIAPPDKSKPKADQHYGGRNIRLPNAAGLHIAILCRYSASTQQISWEIIYTWDGFRWSRFQREPQFLGSSEFGHWSHGGGYLSEFAMVHNGKTYQMMTWINDHYHFQSEIVHGSVNSVDHMTADYMKGRYEKRQLEKWPFFKQYFDGSWEKLAEHTRNAKSSVGIIEYRYDGYFFASAKDQEARMLTTVLTASNGMAMNAVIHDNGFIEVSLLDAAGNVIDGYSKRFDSGDDTNWQVFENLPSGEFQVELKLRNADIYTLNF